MQWIPFATMVLSAIFAIYTLYLLIRKRDNCLMMWCAGLLFYGLSSGLAFTFGLGIKNLILYRLWYLSDAILATAFFAIGIVYYILPRRMAFPLFLLLTIASIYSIIEVFIAPVEISDMYILSNRPFPLQIHIISLFFYLSEMVVIFVALFNGVYSAVTRRRRFFNSISLLLMGGGMILPVVSGISLWSGMNMSLSIYIYELLGLIVFFAGLLIGYAIPVSAEFRPEVDSQQFPE